MSTGNVNLSRNSSAGPNRQLEQELLDQLRAAGKEKPVVVGIDEVGRGCLAGPVMVGVCAVNGLEVTAPVGLNDSKALTERKRNLLFEPLKEWCFAWEVAGASAQEIDEYGIVVALRLAANRALKTLSARGIWADQIILDGTHDWFTPQPKQMSLLGESTPQPTEDWLEIPVKMQVKGDRLCTCVAAAAVLAKVARDRYMEELEDPGYDWATNKGYGTAKHVAALEKLGPSAWHRQSWRLPGVNSEKER